MTNTGTQHSFSTVRNNKSQTSMLPNARRNPILLTIFWALGLSIGTFAQTTLDLDKDKITLNPGEESVVVATGPASLTSESLRWSFNSDYVAIQVSESQSAVVRSTVKAKNRAIESLFVYATFGDSVKQLEIRIRPAVTGDDIRFSSEVPSSIVQNEVLELNVVNGQTLFDSAQTSIDVNPPGAGVAYLDQGRLVVTGRKPGNVAVTIKSNGEPVKTINFTILEAIRRIEAVSTGPIKIKTGESKTLTELVASVNNGETSTFTERLKLVSKDSGKVVISTDGKSLTGKTPGVVEVLVVPDGATAAARSLYIDVVPSPDMIVPSSRSITLAKGTRVSLRWDVLSKGDTVSEKTGEIVLDDSASTDGFSKKIAIEKSGDIFLIRAIERTTDPIELKFKLSGTAITGAVTVQVDDYRVTDFTPLQVRLDLLDERTSNDLFGKKAYDEYFIAKVRLFNAIKRTDDTYYGKPILVYSESFEVKVSLEFRPEDGDDTDWKQLEADNSILNKYYPGGVFTNLGNGRNQCKVIKTPGFFVPYRPLTFEMVLNTYERRDERNLRNRILLVARGAGSLTSFVTAIAVPGPGSDLPLGLDKFQNLLIPSFEKLFPSTREVQRQNIVSMVMRQLEEVPFGSDVTRIIYIPKKKIRGLIPDYFVRISGVSVADACAETAVIDKTGSIP